MSILNAALTIEIMFRSDKSLITFYSVAWYAIRSEITEDKGKDIKSSKKKYVSRCLTLWDLIILGLGSTLGVGVYVLIGAVSVSLAGPSIVLSFLIAAVVALFAGKFGSTNSD